MATARELYKEGKALQTEKQYELAIAKLQASVELDPNDSVPRHALVQCLTELGRHPEAIEAAKKIVEMEPNDQFAFISLSRAFQRAGMIPEAETAMMQGQQVAMRGRG